MDQFGLQVSASGSEQPGPEHSVSRKCWRPGVHQRQTGSAQLAPVAQSLGSNLEASGRSPQISLLPDPDQPGQQHHITRSCKRQEGLPGGQPGRSQCALVNPSGPCRSLQVPALGSERPGPQHLVSRKCGRPGVHPEAVWEHTACSGGTELRFQS